MRAVYSEQRRPVSKRNSINKYYHISVIVDEIRCLLYDRYRLLHQHNSWLTRTQACWQATKVRWSIILKYQSQLYHKPSSLHCCSWTQIWAQSKFKLRNVYLTCCAARISNRMHAFMHARGVQKARSISWKSVLPNHGMPAGCSIDHPPLTLTYFLSTLVRSWWIHSWFASPTVPSSWNFLDLANKDMDCQYKSPSNHPQEIQPQHASSIARPSVLGQLPSRTLLCSHTSRHAIVGPTKKRSACQPAKKGSRGELEYAQYFLSFTLSLKIRLSKKQHPSQSGLKSATPGAMQTFSMESPCIQHGCDFITETILSKQARRRGKRGDGCHKWTHVHCTMF